MSVKQTCYTIYGVRVDLGAQDYFDVEDRIGQCKNDGAVGCFRAGAYDQWMQFLALSWKEVKPGDYVMHPGERPHTPQRDRENWNRQLREVARLTSVRIIDGPGWFTIPSQH